MSGDATTDPEGSVRLVRYLAPYALQRSGEERQFALEDAIPPHSMVNAPMDSQVFELGPRQTKPSEELLIRRKVDHG